MNIAVVGGDERNFYLTEALISKGYRSVWCLAEKYTGFNFSGENFEECMRRADVIILPLPLTRDGRTLNCPFSDSKPDLAEIRPYLKGKISFTCDSRLGEINYFSDEGVTVRNARLTAVGFLSELLRREKSDILNKSALVTGYGNVGKCVCKILSDNGVNVTVAARSDTQRCKASVTGYTAIDFCKAENVLSKFDYIVNTVPARVFSDTAVSKIGAQSMYFEIASGVPKKTQTPIFAYIDCKGMPGKHTPKGAGEVIADFVFSQLRE